jgi:nucleotide-binding universal stress UspA family protein
MKNLLVPCDFSPESREAYQFALQLAAKTSGTVSVLKAIDLPVMYESALGATPYYFDPTLIKELKEDAALQFDKLKKQFPSSVTSTFFSQEGPVTPIIRQFIADHNMDVVVMGTRGASGLEEYLIGSNTEKIVRFSPVPVFAIRKAPAIDSIKNIVLPTTLEKNQEALFSEIKQLQAFFGAKLHLLLVNTPYNLERTADEKERLETFAKQSGLENYTINLRNDFREPNGIVRFATEINADLIAMGTHGRRGLNHLFTGSIAEDVVNHIDCPIWTFSTRTK